ncbi:Uncharacterized protein APZ42_019688 [Daphnia magna]|uniref:Uncharacterized protein n=1 Tax=Daphnia magna TaxID=35525 RepID=A0A0P5VWH4_9CRUS|nr:Uncharacterized protein APZ42_019688 [Daphnia magna]
MSFKRTNNKQKRPCSKDEENRRAAPSLEIHDDMHGCQVDGTIKAQVHHLCETRSGKLCKSESFGWLPLERPLFARE